MNTGLRIAKFAGIIVLCLGSLSLADAAAVHGQKKAKKPQLPPLPSGPTGPVPQVPLDSMKPVLPDVSYKNGQLTIVAPNSTLGDILRAVRKQTGAEIEIPDAPERVVTHVGPGPARDVMAELLNGSRFNYVLLGSPEDASVLARVVLVAKSGSDGAGPNNPAGDQQQAAVRGGVMAPGPPPQEVMPDTSDAEVVPEDNTPDDSTDPAAAEAEQPVTTPDQQGIKTPQQMLQEMQQRQLQMQQQQQQQQPGQPPVPGPVQRPPQQEQ